MLNLQRYFPRRFPEDNGRVSTPGFTKPMEGEAENDEDEMDILTDQDLTEKLSRSDDENLGAKSKSLDALEDDEPDSFLEGDLDVKEQMDRAADAMDSSLRGLQNQGYEDSPRSELGAAFRNTPGGLEEVEMKTDQDLALHHHSPHARKKKRRGTFSPPHGKH